MSSMRLSASCATTWTTPVAPTIRMPRRMWPIGASRSMSHRLRLAQQVVGDDALLDLRCALEDLGQSRVAPVAFDGVQGGVARTTEDLQRVGRHPLGHLRGEQLGHGRLLVAAALLVDLVAHEIEQLARSLDLGRHAGEPKARVLKFADRLAELLSLLSVGGGVFQCAPRQTDRARRGVGAGALEPGGDVVEGAAFLADQGRAGQAAIVEGKLPGLPAEITDL